MGEARGGGTADGKPLDVARCENVLVLLIIVYGLWLKNGPPIIILLDLSTSTERPRSNNTTGV